MSYSLPDDGFEIVKSVLHETEVGSLRRALSSLNIAPGHRNLMQLVPEVKALAVSQRLITTLQSRVGAEPFPVRSIFFNKTPSANWLVPWHQDLSIAVKERLDLAGYGPWSIKNGVIHVQPPSTILESMITVRLHLDDCDDSNGALRVIRGSHRLGKLDASAISEIRSKSEEVTCTVKSGDALIMRPMLLHASSEAVAVSHRRVVHLEYATCRLDGALDWAEKFPSFPSFTWERTC
jgi:ectoine hydroxylase-related dioxygenase (phytanoyl-CoA dioxygenase family)